MHPMFCCYVLVWILNNLSLINSLQAVTRPNSCRRLYWTTWKRMPRQMPHWWYVYIRLTVPLTLWHFESEIYCHVLTVTLYTIKIWMIFFTLIKSNTLSSSLLESFMLPSGSVMPPQRLRSPCGTRIPRMKTHRMDHNMPRTWKLLVKLCSVLKNARNSCATSLRPCQLSSPHLSKNVWCFILRLTDSFVLFVSVFQSYSCLSPTVSLLFAWV